MSRLIHAADKGEDFHRVRAQVRRQFVLNWLADLRKAAFVDRLDDPDANLLELSQSLVFELECYGWLILANLVGRGLHPFLLFVGEAAPHLVADEHRGV